MALTEWQKHLEDHFQRLHGQKSSETGGAPLFGLEHGLTNEEFIDLENGIHTHIREYPPANKHWLTWIVYSCEIGYEYAGDQYWQTFEQRTPGWVENGNRNYIRNFFYKFHSEFNGAKPTGTWAEHFTIICWPITHAILPKDLQLQLAKTLHYLSYGFNAELFNSPSMLGEQIAARSWSATSRFQNFAQERLLVGQIAAALLLHGKRISQTLILPNTLNRIVADLDRESRARNWLRAAQMRAGQAHLRGLGKKSIERKDLQRVKREVWREEFARLAVEPCLMLWPVAPSSWDVVIEIPDLSPLLLRFPNSRSVLTGSRCSIMGSARRSPRARSSFLHCPQRETLKQWPCSTEVLLKFEDSSPELDGVLRTDCLLRPGPSWLFRIAADGLAYEVRSKVVRPGQRYILLSQDSLEIASRLGKEITITCEGVHAIRLDIPPTISPEWQELIENLGLTQARTLLVWPVGLPASSWDGEGRGVWLSTDQPCIGIEVDHPIDRISLNLGEDVNFNIEVAQCDSDNVAFIELPLLLPGFYRLNVRTHSSHPHFQGQEGELEIVIRKPRSWEPGETHIGPLNIIFDPPAPTLEQLWEGVAEIEAHGPKDRQLNCSVSLFEAQTQDPILKRMLPCLTLPVDSTSWRKYFQRNFREHSEIQNNYDLSESCQIDFDCDELGFFSLRCEREVYPIRWIVRGNGRKQRLTLIDNRDIDVSVEVNHFGFEEPDIPVPIDSDLAVLGFVASETGGMYTARVGDFKRSVVLPPQVRSVKLSQLGIDHQLRKHKRTVEDITTIISIIELWANARTSGNILAFIRQQSVLSHIVNHLFSVLCGENWQRQEKIALNRPGTQAIKNLSREIASNPSERAVGVVLKREYAELCGKPIQEMISLLSSLAKRFLISPEKRKVVAVERKGKVIRRQHAWSSHKLKWLSEFALRMASSPETVRSWAVSDFSRGLEYLLKVPTLARAARFLVIAIDRHFQEDSVEGAQRFKGWYWQ